MSTPETDIQKPTDPSQASPLHPADERSDAVDPSLNTEASCNADAFMDEEDSEAVAERLRQLGYI